MVCRRFALPSSLAALLVLGVFAGSAAAQEEATAGVVYHTPAKILVDLADAPRTPVGRLDPSRRWILMLTPGGLPPIRELAQRELRLAGIRIDPQTHSLSRRPYFTAM